MKKLLVILIASVMITTALPAVLGNDEYGLGQVRDDDFGPTSITTNVVVAGGTDNPGGDPPPFIKYKWELVDDYCGLVDDDPDTDYLSVALEPCGTRTVHYFALVEKTTYNIANVYVDVWHPDGEFKYQVLLKPFVWHRPLF